MRKRLSAGVMVTIVIAALLAIYVSVDSHADGGQNVFTIDVACDARTYSQNNVDPSAGGSHRGDTFIVSGKIYSGGSIPSGDGVFSPDNRGSIGRWICRGVWMVISDQLAAGVSPAFDTSQIYLLPDDSNQLFSEGLEGSQPTLRALSPEGPVRWLALRVRCARNYWAQM